VPLPTGTSCGGLAMVILHRSNISHTAIADDFRSLLPLIFRTEIHAPCSENCDVGVSVLRVTMVVCGKNRGEQSCGIEWLWEWVVIAYQHFNEWVGNGHMPKKQYIAYCHCQRFSIIAASDFPYRDPRTLQRKRALNNIRAARWCKILANWALFLSPYIENCAAIASVVRGGLVYVLG
jgi:hypothetical protein